MAFGDDIEDLGFDLTSSPKEAVMMFTVTNDFGDEYDFQKEIPDEDATKMLYLVSIDMTIHGKFLGHGVDGRRYYRFILDREYEDISEIRHELIDGNWILTRERHASEG